MIRWSGAPILLNGTIDRDPEVLKLLQKYKPAVYELTESVIGYSKVLLDGGENCRKKECNLGNLIADALIYHRVNQYNGTFWTDASISLVQGGGIRAPANVGTLTKFDLKTILPFNNTMYIVNITGTSLRQVLEHSVYHYTGDRGEFLQMSGMRVVYNLKKEPGHRVETVLVLCTECGVPQYSKLDENKVYRVIISRFLYIGGDGYSMFEVSFLSETTFHLISFLCKFLKYRFLSSRIYQENKCPPLSSIAYRNILRIWEQFIQRLKVGLQ